MVVPVSVVEGDQGVPTAPARHGAWQIVRRDHVEARFAEPDLLGERPGIGAPDAAVEGRVAGLPHPVIVQDEDAGPPAHPREEGLEAAASEETVRDGSLHPAALSHVTRWRPVRKRTKATVVAQFRRQNTYGTLMNGIRVRASRVSQPSSAAT